MRRRWSLALTLVSSLATCSGDDPAPVPPAPELTQLRFNAFLHPSVDADGFTTFVEELNAGFATLQLPVRLSVASVTPASAYSPTTESARNAEFAMFVGPGWGGYYPPPLYSMGANSDAPYAFTLTGVLCELHEIAHFLGAEDLYVLTPESMAVRPELQNELLVSCYFSSIQEATLLPSTRDTLMFNLNQIAQGGRAAIYYPSPLGNGAPGVKTRMSLLTSFNLDLPVVNQACEIKKMTFDFNTWTADYDAVPVAAGSTDQTGALSFQMGFDNSWYIGLKVVCGDTKYFVPAPVFDACFFANDTQTVSACSLSCPQADDWCEPR